jgi:hypothetical protein
MGKKCLELAEKMYFLKLDFGRGLYIEVSVYSCVHFHITCCNNLVIFISCRYLLDGLAEKVVGYKDFML